MAALIYHNPKCGTSRKALARLQDNGAALEIVEYLKDGWSRPQLLTLLAIADITPRDILRLRGTPAEELGLADPDASDDQIIEAMIAHPILVERPIVCTPKGVALCRPIERIEALL